MGRPMKPTDRHVIGIARVQRLSKRRGANKVVVDWAAFDCTGFHIVRGPTKRATFSRAVAMHTAATGVKVTHQRSIDPGEVLRQSEFAMLIGDLKAAAHDAGVCVSKSCARCEVDRGFNRTEQEDADALTGCES
jgi:hypothetical protein